MYPTPPCANLHGGPLRGGGYRGRVITHATTVRGREALLAATDHHPYVRHTVAPDEDPVGYRSGDTVVWQATVGHGPLGCAYGDPVAAVELFGSVPELTPLRRLNLPRTTADQLTGRVPVLSCTDWDFLWAPTPPPASPGEERVVPLSEADHAEMVSLIDAGFPTTTSRPGDAGVAGWYGIRDGDRLVALGADRSHGDVGFIAGLAVAPDQRGRGLGSALTTGMTRRLFDRYDRVGLGVWADNAAGRRLYRRLGFTGSLPRTSVRLG